jgi:Recombination endonuclease VII
MGFPLGSPIFLPKWIQDGHCFFCDRTPDQERYGVLCVDHCHETGRIRGLLCITHNRSLGVFGDNEQGLLKVLAYVRGKAPG